MKKNLYILTVLSLVSLLVACNKEKPVDMGDPAASSPKKVTISATLVDATTRVTFDPTFDDTSKPTGMSHTWEEGDKLRVTDANNSENTQVYDLVGGAGTPNGVFEGEAVEATSYNVEAIPNGNFETGNRQTQAKDGATGHLKYVAAATGVTDLTQISLNETSGIIGIIAKLPAGAAATINMLTIETSTDDFATKTTLAVALTSQEEIDNDDILKVYANVPAGWTIAAGTKMFLKFGSTNDDHKVYTRYQEFATAADPVAGKFNTLKLNCSNIDKYAGGSDAGTSANPYLIADPYQLKAVDGLLETEKRFFKVIDDIDMTGVSWSKLNPSSPYKPFDFDGNQKTISYLTGSLFYIINGSVKDLTLDHSDIKERGILAEYIQGAGNTVTNVTVSNGKVNSSSNNVGGLIGLINSGTSGQTTATITNCTVSDTEVKGAGVVGGFVGFADAQVEISGCIFTGGAVTASARFAGGFVGSTGNYKSTIENCQVEEATINVSISNNDFRAGGFVGQLQKSVTIKGCTVGATGDKVALVLSAPASGKVYNVGGFVGVCYGTITQNGSIRSKAFAMVSSGNPVAEANSDYQLNLGGFAGYHTGKIEYADADVTMDSVCGKYVGGFCGYLLEGGNIQHCTASGTVSGNLGIGGFVGFSEKGSLTECTSNAVVSRTGSWGSSFGVFGGIAKEGTISKCSATSDISINVNYVGGFIGGTETKAGTSLVISKCWSTGSVSSNAAQCGGFIGRIASEDATANVSVEDCYETGSVQLSNQRRGGLIGQINSGNVSVTRCYASGDVNGSFALGGLVGFMNNTATIENCAAWNGNVTAGSFGNANWSTGSVIGVAWPIASLKNNYRNPDLSIKAYWGNVTGFTKELVSDYNHPDVSSSTPLIVVDKTDGSTLRNTTATSAASGQDNYPLFAYHGKVEAGKTLSQLASTTLGWSSDVWKFEGELPTLK